MRRGPEMMAVMEAGAEAKPLWPLTKERAKPAIPFGGIYRIIDFPLSNCYHSGIRHILITIQYRCNSLVRHVETAWKLFVPELNGFIQCTPPQRVKARWYEGTGDAVYQNLFRIREVNPETVLVLPGDHLFQADFRELLAFHRDAGADVTVGCAAVPLGSAAGHHAVMTLDEGSRVTHLQNAPETPHALEGSPSQCLASMGIYLFQRKVLEELLELGPGQDRQFDLGRDLLPAFVKSGGDVRAWLVPDRSGGKDPYWRDLSTVESYYEANMDLVQPTPRLNLYDRTWPTLSHRPFFLPPAKFVWNWGDNPPHRIGRAVDSIVSNGVIVSGGLVERSVLGSEVRVGSYATVTDAILFDGVTVGRHAQIRRAIVDKGVVIPDGARVGVDIEEDRRRFTVTTGGIAVVPKGFRFDLATARRGSRALTPTGDASLKDVPPVAT